jgi:uncharacterized protein DUF397
MDMMCATWRTSSYSGDNDGNCVEVGTLARAVNVRDSRDRGGPQLAFTAVAWTVFTSQFKADAGPAW